MKKIEFLIRLKNNPVREDLVDMTAKKWRISAMVGVSGAAGGSLRFLVGEWLDGSDMFPLGTLLCNILGCFLLGAFTALVASRPSFGETARLSVGVGLIGSFTTFSAWGAETYFLLHARQWPVLAAYLGLSIFGGLFFAWAGYRGTMRLADRKERQSGM